ncbi:nucleotidyltransferase domain-containing protein [Diplocloster agilis]|uniref:nucleotidyltransferase domain-containing protein n=1 Tax=Diplocloster agilis TaxID=2850323 RepID=UPI000821969D|nr:nucleotidyltransferase domain-containing protein [Suonthocola fibrivorans]MCU6733109.1 nucleotidyltransferase domain-containing protein [Suonthocola fibrivorans]SCI75677.1 aminoglycoside resistance protein [uncultured Clostridium sp.]
MSTKGEDATQESVTIDKLPLPDRYKRGLHAALRVIYSMNIEGFLYVILYGSCVTGKIKTSSDIDLLIVTEKKLVDRQLRSLIRENVDQTVEVLNVSVDIVFYTEQTLRTDQSIFTNNIRKYGKIVRKDETHGFIL